MIHVVKRRGHKEDFDERKVYASAYAACLNVHMGEQEAERMAALVSQEAKDWIREKEEVSSQEIFDFVIKALRNKNENAAFMYETHRDIS